MNDVKLKFQPGHASDNDWMAPAKLRQLFWNVSYACNFRCQVCFSNSGSPAPDELTTAEAKQMLEGASRAGVGDIVISGGEPFMRPDLVELLTHMGKLGITGRIATNGSLLTPDLIGSLRRETRLQSFQVSLDTLDPDLYAELHGAPPEMLEVALQALREIKAQGFHTTVSVRLTPRSLPGIPALLDRAAAEGWTTVTIHCPVYTGRAESTWPVETDLLAQLEPVFEHFVRLPEHWVVETNIPWARYHKLMVSLSKRTRVAHAGCGAARMRLAIGASGQISPCICLDRGAMLMGNVRQDDLGTVFRESPIAKLMRAPWEHGVCSDCGNVRTCGGGCRAGAAARGGRVDALDPACPVRRARAMKEAPAHG